MHPVRQVEGGNAGFVYVKSDHIMDPTTSFARSYHQPLPKQALIVFPCFMNEQWGLVSETMGAVDNQGTPSLLQNPGLHLRDSFPYHWRREERIRISALE